jgi:phospholipid-binding lipoprotein MlaA
MKKIKILCLAWVCLFFCNSIIAETQKPYVNPKDPYERFNRVMFNFNDFIDKWALKPIATLYNKIMPKPLNKGINNFYFNLDTVPTVANDVLQGNIYQATSDTWRLGLNSTVGILGFFDVASGMGLERNSEDFGLTLARWGYTNSNYLVIPLLGPSTVRDGIGFPVNYYLFSIYPYINPPRDRYRLYLLGVVSRRAELLHYQGVLEQLSVDKYVFMRDAYMQRRAYQIQRNKELGDPYLNKDLENQKDIEKPIDPENPK